MNNKRSNHACSLVNNRYVYVSGGRDEELLSLQTVEMFDTETEKWSITPKEMERSRFRHSSTTLDQNIIVMGKYYKFLLNQIDLGGSSAGIMKSTQRYHSAGWNLQCYY